MALTEAAKNAMLDELASLITHAGLANAGNEVNSGGDYTREALSWGAASGGVVGIDTPAVFDVDGGNTVNQVILRDSATIDAGTDYGSAAITEEVFGGDGTYTLNTLTITLSDPA